MIRDFSKETFDILIQAGQSNSDGTAFGNVYDPYQQTPLVWYYNADGTFQVAQEKVTNNAIQSNFSLTFARKYVQSGMLTEGRKLLILRTAVGGTGFSDNHWKSTDDLYLRMMEMIRDVLALNSENRLKALLWHQGETDALNNMTYDYYREHITELIANVRNTFDVPTLPFIAGDFVQDWKHKNADISAPIISALRDVCANQNCAFVETEGLDSNREDGYPHPFGWSDDIHFCRRAIYELGERYFDAYTSSIMQN